MKKYLIILLCLVFAFCAAACEEDKGKDRSSNNEAQAETQKPTLWQPSDKQNAKPKNTSQGSSGGAKTPTDAITDSQREALKAADELFEDDNYSYDFLVDALETMGYSHEDAVYAADHCGADWNEQAYENGLHYLDITNSDHDDMMEYLEDYAGFTYDQAKYAADKLFPHSNDSKKEALEAAEHYLNIDSYSRGGLYYQLQSDGFTAEEAQYAVDNCGADWYDEAAQAAAVTLKYNNYTREELIDSLIADGFSEPEAEYGADMNGL